MKYINCPECNDNGRTSEVCRCDEVNRQLDRFVMQNFVFVYILDGAYRVLDINDSQAVGKKLINEGWKHTATMKPETWMEFFLNGSETERFEAIESISA